MAILMKFATCHVRNAFKRPLRPNAPTVRVLASVILKGIGWAFRKLYPLKIPGMVHQSLLAPQRLVEFQTLDLEIGCSNHINTELSHFRNIDRNINSSNMYYLLIPRRQKVYGMALDIQNLSTVKLDHDILLV